MQDLNSANITMEAMDCEFKTTTNQTKPKENFFDEKNYLNIRLGNDETSKELKVRLLPIDSNSKSL